MHSSSKPVRLLQYDHPRHLPYHLKSLHNILLLVTLSVFSNFGKWLGRHIGFCGPKSQTIDNGMVTHLGKHIIETLEHSIVSSFAILIHTALASPTTHNSYKKSQRKDCNVRYNAGNTIESIVDQQVMVPQQCDSLF